MRKVILLLPFVLMLSGCYYLQAASGQWDVLRKRQALQDVIDNPATSAQLAQRLALVNRARDFSIAELGLPDNNSYRSYAALDRDYVVWNVFAAPEFDLQAKHWCFPVAGCVNYRGYFSKNKAVRAAERLSRQGYDAAVGGVVAYSTLGHFDDPILSTMLRWDDVSLVATLFHELAHQVVYVQDDSAFNESFASAVEEISITRWLKAEGHSEQIKQFEDNRALRNRLATHIAQARASLAVVYASDFDIDAMRERKKDLMQALAALLDGELAAAGRTSSAWLNKELNNARLISSSLYDGYLPSFRALYVTCSEEIRCFYNAAESLAELDKVERDEVLSTRDFTRFRSGANDQ